LPRDSAFGKSTRIPMVTPTEKPDIHSEAFLHTLMRRQLKLSIACASTFMLALLGLPLANYFCPEVMATRILGFTLTWFILGVLFFPFVWVISYVFIKRSIALEEGEVSEIEKERGGTEESEKVGKWENGPQKNDPQGIN
jgi:uncharacterized membrane protein (DUF485 family)